MIEHHSHWIFKGVEIENHYQLIKTLTKSKKEENFEEFIKSLLAKNDEHNSTIHTFNALFLIRHIYSHFYYSDVNLRQIIDWLMLIRKYDSVIDWNIVNIEIDKCGMNEFVKLVNIFLVYAFDYNYTNIRRNYLNTIKYQMFLDMICNGNRNGNWRKIWILFYFKDRRLIWHLRHKTAKRLSPPKMKKYLIIYEHIQR